MSAAPTAELICEFTVSGKPASRGSKRAFQNKKTGRINLVDGKNSYRYMADIKKAAIEAMQGRPPADGPIMLYWQARFSRPKSHYGKNGLKATAPVFFTRTPDCSKVVRGIEDAIAKIAYLDDKQIVGYVAGSGKVWTEDESCSTRVQVWQLT